MVSPIVEAGRFGRCPRIYSPVRCPLYALSTEQGSRYPAKHIGQAEMPTLVFVSQPFVVDAQEVQDQGL